MVMLGCIVVGMIADGYGVLLLVKREKVGCKRSLRFVWELGPMQRWLQPTSPQVFKEPLSWSPYFAHKAVFFQLGNGTIPHFGLQILVKVRIVQDGQ